MNAKEKAEKITSKDEQTALTLIKEMVENSDTELFEELVNRMNFLFPFVRQNVVKRMEMSICKINYANLYKFSDIYSPDFDKTFATAFKYFGEPDTKNKMLEMLKSGTTAQKTYSARYFEQTKDLIAVRELMANAFDEDEDLADACASALGALNEINSYEIALAKLNSNDDFEMLSALNFFIAYGKNPPLEDILNAVNNSGMPENFAGKIPYLIPLNDLIDKDLNMALTVIDYILAGFGEILPLSEVFGFELYDVLEKLISIENSQKDVVLLRAKSKFETICTNDEYTFDEDKNTKDELKEIHALLNSLGEDFWRKTEENSLKELAESKQRAVSAIEMVKEFNIKSAVPQILDMIYETEDETLICEGLSALKALNALAYTDKNDVLPRLTNENLKAISESLFN